MKPARSEPSRLSRAQHAMGAFVPAINSLLMGFSGVAGGAGLVASLLEENAFGLILSVLLLAAAAELYFTGQPQAEE